MAVRLMARDIALLKAVNDLRALRIHHIQHLFFNSQSPAYGRVQKLIAAEYLVEHYITQVGRGAAASPRVFSISELAAQVLVRACGYTPQDLRPAGQEVGNWKSLQHILTIADVLVPFMKATQTGTVKLRQFVDELAFRAQPDQVLVTNTRGTQQHKPVLPDGFMILDTPLGNLNCFVEADRGTESIAQFKSQIAVYQAYMLSGQYQQRYQTRSLRILVVAPHPRRLAQLRRAIADLGGADRYWLTTLEQLTPATVLAAPIWQPVDQDELQAFLPPAALKGS